MYPKKVYVGLGGNIGDSYSILNQALQKIAELPSIDDLKISRFFSTTPVSSIPQKSYVNAVCSFNTIFSARTLLLHLQRIEIEIGKEKKLKEAPRTIDLDILFFGTEQYDEPDLQIPHPRWSERLFVVTPLADLIDDIYYPKINQDQLQHLNLKDYLKNFPNIHQETVTPISEILRNLCIQYDLKNSLLVKANP